MYRSHHGKARRILLPIIYFLRAEFFSFQVPSSELKFRSAGYSSIREIGTLEQGENEKNAHSQNQ